MTKETVESLLNPSLKVSRPVAACARCRSAKVKCIFDGKSPACTACERSGKGQECSSANDEFARGKERSYTSALEAAIHRLQKRINQVKEQGNGNDTVMSSTYTRPSLQRKPISNSQRKEAISLNDLINGFGFLTVNATARDFQGFSSTMSFSKMLSTISLKEPLPIFNEIAIPPRNTISHLIDHYFETLYVILPFFSETDFMGSLSRIYQESPSFNVTTPFDMWCFHLVLAISSTSLCQIRTDESYNTALFHISSAMKLIENVIYPGSLSSIQALLFLVQYALADPEYFDQWYLIGMASRLLVDLGLHCEPAPELKISKHALDLRRRIFYCTYALDRLVSMSLGLAFSFTDDSAPNVLLPTLATDQEAKSPTPLFTRSVRPSLFLFDIRRVQSSFYQKTRWSSRVQWTQDYAENYVSSTLEDIRSWQASLPDSFSYRHLQLFHLEALYSQALVLSPNQVIQMSAITHSHRLLFFECAVHYSEQFKHMIQSAELKSCLSYADCCRARFVSRQFQNFMWSSFDLLTQASLSPRSPSLGPGPINQYARALQFLDNMSQILEWPSQRWGISALKEIFEQESAVLMARLRAKQQEQVEQLSPQGSTLQHSDHQSFELSQPGISPPSHISIPSPHAFQSFPPMSDLSPEGTSLYSNPAMHRANLLRFQNWQPNGDQVNPELPSGTLPRRSYQFTGTGN